MIVTKPYLVFIVFCTLIITASCSLHNRDADNTSGDSVTNQPLTLTQTDYTMNDKPYNIVVSETDIANFSISADSINPTLCNLLFYWVQPPSDSAVRQLKLLLGKGATPNCDCEITYSTRRLVSYIPIVKHMLKRQYNTNTLVTTPIHLAVWQNDLNLVKILTNKSVDLNQINAENEYPITIAITNNNTAMIDLLLQSGADIKNAFLYKSTDVETIRYLVSKGADPKTIDVNFALDDQTKLQELLKLKPDLNRYTMDAEKVVADVNILKLLLDNGLSPSAICNFPDECPLIFAAIKFGSIETFDLLVSRGADIKTRCESGFAETTLAQAVKSRRYSIVEKLVAKGMNINERDKFNRTPIYYAIEEDDAEMNLLLIRKGANLKNRDMLGETPMLYAVKNNKYVAIQQLIKNGGNPNDKNSNNESLLQCAIDNNNYSMVKLLIENGANTQAKIENLPLAEYARQNDASLEIIDLLKSRNQ